MKKFTFKKEPRQTGLAAVGNPYPPTEVKFQSLVCGMIYPPNMNSAGHHWFVMLSVVQAPTKSDPCPFRWRKVGPQFETENAARVWINERVDDLLDLELYFFDKDD